MSQRIGKYRLSDMKLDFVSLVPAGDDPMARVVIAKTAPATDDPLEGKMGDKIAKTDLDPEVVAYIDGLESEVETLTKAAEAETEKVTGLETKVTSLEDQITKMVPKDADTADAISKAALEKADPAIRAMIEKQAADLAEATTIAKAEREARLGQVYLSKAQALPMITEAPADLAGLLRRMADALPEEDVTKMETILKAANAQITASSVFDSFGVGGGDTTVSKSVEAQAEEIRKADPSLSIEQAQAKVYADNPDLFAQAMKGE